MAEMEYAHDIANFVLDIRDTARQSNGFVIEIGIGKGNGSTIAVYEGLAEHANPLHVSVDIDPDALSLFSPPVPWWCFLIENSCHDTTREHVREIAGGRVPGLIFIDTHHTPDHIARELEVWSPMAGAETTWLFHDTYMMGPRNSMTDTIVEWAGANGWVYDDWHVEPHGLGRMRKP